MRIIMYKGDIWSLILREESRLWVLDYRMLRRTCGPKVDEIIVCWRNLHNEELHNVCFLPNIMIRSRRMTCAGHVACMTVKVNAYAV